MEALLKNTTSTGVKAVPTGAITVDEIKDSLKKGVKEAQIRQLYRKSYASVKTSNEFKQSLFSDDELGLESKDYEEARVTWIPVGMKHKVKDVEKALALMPDACIYKVLSHEPILSSDQIRVLDQGLSGEALEDFLDTNKIKGDDWTDECTKILYNKIAESQLVVFGENHDGPEDADEAVLYNGLKQYRQTFFWKTQREDIDLRVVQGKQDIPELVIASQEVGATVKA